MTTGTETFQGADANLNADVQQTNQTINIASPVALQLIVDNCDTAAAYYCGLFGAKVFSGQVIPGMSNPSITGEVGTSANGSPEALATRTIVIGNHAINLVSKQYVSNLLNIPVKRLGEQKNTLPVVITVNVDNVSLFLDRAAVLNATVVKGLTTADDGSEFAYIRGQEGYVWCLTNIIAVNAAGGVLHGN